MAAITEDYCSFEVAVLLKERGGVDCECNLLKMPLHKAMRWLREVHKLHIITIPYAPFDRYPFHHPGEADMVYIAQLFKGIIPVDEVGRRIVKLTHEEACDAAIKYCLENLI